MTQLPHDQPDDDVVEDEENVPLATRQVLGFICPKGHNFEITFAVEAELPTEWECPRCGSIALRSDGTKPEDKEVKAPRTHWDMLTERRSHKELDELLKERLTDVRENPRY